MMTQKDLGGVRRGAGRTTEGECQISSGRSRSMNSWSYIAAGDQGCGIHTYRESLRSVRLTSSIQCACRVFPPIVPMSRARLGVWWIRSAESCVLVKPGADGGYPAIKTKRNALSSCLEDVSASAPARTSTFARKGHSIPIPLNPRTVRTSRLLIHNIPILPPPFWLLPSAQHIPQPPALPSSYIIRSPDYISSSTSRSNVFETQNVFMIVLVALLETLSGAVGSLCLINPPSSVSTD
ncbi:hypothetical protein R3P38DRAFT_891833 [Favolaschia claudopus]|uniref:Uncharacterized protein n=1 Tax=Favolaschia claudopus TaxID=2862362 RepID=A0AAW0BUT8_9AGAR